MKILKWAVSAFVIFATSVALAQLNGILTHFGNHPKYGSYSTQLELRPTPQAGVFDVIRVAEYGQLKFDGLRVQEVWTGRGQIVGQEIQIQYALKKANYLKSSFGITKSPEDFKTSVPYTQRILLNENRASVVSGEGVIFRETLYGQGPLGAYPLWRNLRQLWHSSGNSMPAVGRILYELKIEKVVKWYREQPEVLAYAHRPEFQNKSQFFVYDPTDFDFYHNRKDTVRVVNSILDNVTLTEAISRRNAYAPTLEEKAEYFDNKMLSHNLNAYGFYSRSILDSQGRIAKMGHDGDGALWTGIYLVSQAMRYKATGHPQALENVKRTARALFLTMEITGDESEFARYVIPYDPSVAGPEWRRGAGPHADKMWIYGGNNDMVRGLLTGLAWAALVVPQSDAQFRNELLHYSFRALKLRIINEKKQNLPLARGLRAVVTNDRKDIEKFGKETISFHQGLAEMFGTDAGFYYGGIADWSGINLGVLSAITNIAVTEKILKVMPSRVFYMRDMLEEFLNRNQEALVEQWRTYEDARRDFLTIAAFSFKGSASPGNLSQWEKRKHESIWGLREIPIHRSRYDVQYDYSLMPNWSLSAWPRLPWKSVNERNPVRYHMQGVYQYPLFEGLGYGNNYIWKESAFTIEGSSSSRVVEPGVDYLYSYWMARMSGLISPDKKTGLVSLPERAQGLSVVQ